MSLLSNIFKISSRGKEISSQNPLSVDGDSVHAKDVDISRSILGNFLGAATDFFDDLHSENLDNTLNNPKLLTIHFHRTLVTPIIGIGSTEGGSFSNVKVIGILSGEIEVVLADFTDDNTNRTTQYFEFPNAGLNAFRLEFHTTDPISITNIYIPKLVAVVAFSQSSIVYADSYGSPYLLNGGSDSMKVDGSGSPIDFEYEITGSSSAKLYRSFIDLSDGAQNFNPDNFGALTALTNGVDIIVVKDGFEIIIENWKTNMDISMTMYDFTSPFKLGAYIGRWTIGKDVGSPLTLFPGDKIIVRIKDDLTGLDSFRLRLKLNL